MNLRAELSDPRRYLRQLERLRAKYARSRQLYDLNQDGASLAAMVMNGGDVARMLADAVGAGTYGQHPAELRPVTVNGKRRVLYTFALTDRIVHGVIASILNERMEPCLSSWLYSYRKGMDWCRAVSDFALYVRTHRRTRPDPRRRGLYVLRRDVYKYTDSIPVDRDSGLWLQLRGLLPAGAFDGRRGRRYWQLLEDTIRPQVCTEEGLLHQNIRGLPTGSAISTSVFNLYLQELDAQLDAIPGAFYARYSDDMLFAHPEPAVARDAADIIDTTLHRRGLRTNEGKDVSVFFNGAGRPSERVRGSDAISFLGCDVSFSGTISLNRKKQRRLLRDLESRARRALYALDDRRPATAGPVVCEVINRALSPNSPLRQKSALMLCSVITNRGQLAQLDYQIARMVASLLARERGVRAFREVPYRTLREHWHLRSLMHSRNRSRSRSSLG